MQSDKKDIRMYEPSELEIRDVMNEIEQQAASMYGSPFAAGDIGSPQFGDQPFELLNMFSKIDDKELNQQIFGDKTIDFGDFSADMEID